MSNETQATAMQEAEWLANWRAEITRLTAERDAALATIERVRELHYPSTDHGTANEPYCVGCLKATGEDSEFGSWSPYPCPTAAALADPEGEARP